MEVIHLADARKNQKFDGMSLMSAIFFTHFISWGIISCSWLDKFHIGIFLQNESLQMFFYYLLTF